MKELKNTVFLGEYTDKEKHKNIWNKHKKEKLYEENLRNEKK